MATCSGTLRYTVWRLSTGTATRRPSPRAASLFQSISFAATPSDEDLGRFLDVRRANVVEGGASSARVEGIASERHRRGLRCALRVLGVGVHGRDPIEGGHGRRHHEQFRVRRDARDDVQHRLEAEHDGALAAGRGQHGREVA